MTRRLIQEIDLDTGVVVKELYRTNRYRQRDPAEGPTYVWRDPETGYPIVEEYRWRGLLHREDGPAERHWDEEGRLMRETYLQCGVLHRDPKEGPAEILRSYRSGREVIFRETYCLYNEPYRDPKDGPFRIDRAKLTGEVTREQFAEPSEMAPRRPTFFRDRPVRPKPSGRAPKL